MDDKNIRVPTREEMIEGIALGFKRYLEQHYEAPYRHSISFDIEKAVKDHLDKLKK